MKLQTKLIIAFVVITVLVTVQAFTIFRATNDSTQNYEAIVQQSAPAINALDQMKAAEAALIQEVFSYGLKLQLGVLTGISMVNNQEIYQYQENWRLIEEGLTKYKTASSAYASTEVTTRLRSVSMDVYQRGLMLLTMSTQVDDAVLLSEAHTALEEANEDFVVVLQEALQIESDQLQQLSELSTQTAAHSLALTLVSAVMLITTIVSIGFIAVQTVSKPIRRLEGAARRIAEGDYSQRTEVVSRDEIGQMTIAFNTMADAIHKRDLKLSELNKTLEQRVIETQQARDQAERSDQVKSAFLASMSHELRTPLNAILNFSHFISSGMLGPVNAEQVDLLDKLSLSGKHLLSLINDVLDISKIESGSLQLFKEDSLELSEDLQAVAAAGQALLKDKPVELEVIMEPGLPFISGDRRRLRQIMLNLIANACKFTDTGRITVRLRQQTQELVFSVTDTGPGIAAEDHDLIFETFRQSETGMRQGEGTGLGLPISRKLTEAHGGRMWVESRPGEGATFYAALPIPSPLPVSSVEGSRGD
jgi:signal transduction histidine kinase